MHVGTLSPPLPPPVGGNARAIDQGLVNPFAPLKSVFPASPVCVSGPTPDSSAGNDPIPPTHTLMPEKCTAIFYFFNTLLVALPRLPLSASLTPMLRGVFLSLCSGVAEAMRDAVAARASFGFGSEGRGAGRVVRLSVAHGLGFFRSIDNLFG